MVSTPLGSPRNGRSLSTMFQLLLLILWVATLCVIAGRKFERYVAGPQKLDIQATQETEETHIDRRKIALIRELAKLSATDEKGIGRQVELLKGIVMPVTDKVHSTRPPDVTRKPHFGNQNTDLLLSTELKRLDRLPEQPSYKTDELYNRLKNCYLRVAKLVLPLQSPDGTGFRTHIDPDVQLLLTETRIEMSARDNENNVNRLEKTANKLIRTLLK
eukprot:TRINITY_DN568_c0_g2_i1.p1 TRINITY_DN568_c0_g2~~TRINITY_DN568_c0_g2_i1.p1  ORF type:complete len:217 (+),score=7.87 TRINITY_DN568_c0_g2_i1:119-769(+)